MPAATTRAITSGGPPGGNGTSIVMERVGKFAAASPWARAAVVVAPLVNAQTPI